MFQYWMSGIALWIFLNVSFAEIRLEYVEASEQFLSNPHDLKLSPDGKFLLVSDVGNNRVAFLDPATLELLGSFGEDHQSGTHDVEFDAKGNLYVADTHNNRVTVYELDGMQAKLIQTLDRGIRGPEGVLAHPNGDIYVAGAWSGNTVRFDQSGQVISELKGLSSPHDLEIRRDGNIWLSDSGNSRILLVSPDLDIVGELSRQQYDFDGVRYMDVMDDGTLIAADKNNHQIKVIAADGKMILVVGDDRGKGPDRFVTPEGVEIQGDTVWFSDSGNNRVVKYRIIR